MRQQGYRQFGFRSALEGLRNNTLEYRDQALLAIRTASFLTAAERRSFDDAIRVYFKNNNVRDCNERHLRDTSNPVIKLRAKHNDEAVSSRASVDECRQLEYKVKVAINCRIILLSNIQTEAGLVNSTTSYLNDIEQPVSTTNLRTELLQALIICIKRTNYSRPILQDLGNRYITILIFRSKRAFYRRGQEHYREQFPIRIAYAITVYKA